MRTIDKILRWVFSPRRKDNGRPGAYLAAPGSGGGDADALLRMTSRGLEIRQSEQSLLFTLGQAIAGLKDIADITGAVASYAAHIMHLQKCTVWQVEGGELVLAGHRGMEGLLDRDRRMLLADYGTGICISRNEPVSAGPEDFFADDEILCRALRREGLGCILAVPMRLNGVPVGALAVYADAPEALEEESAGLLTVLADGAALSLANAVSYRELEKRTRQMSSLGRISNAINSLLPLEKIMAMILQAVLDDFQALGCLVLLYDEKGIPRLDSYCGAVNAVRLEEAFAWSEVVPVLSPEESSRRVERDDYPDLFRLTDDSEECYAVLLPLLVKGRVAGMMVVFVSQVVAVTEADVELLRAFANQVTISIENSLLYDNMERRINELTMLVRVVTSIASTLDLKTIMDTIVELAGHVVPGSACAISLADEDGKGLRIFSSQGLSRALVDRLDRPGEDGGLSAAVMDTGRPLIIADLMSDSRSAPCLKTKAAGISSYLGVPLTRDGRAVGALNIYCRKREQFSQDEVRLLWAFADQAAVAVHNARLFDQVQSYSRRLEVIRQEVHHRVKNNLQTVADLLHLEMLRTDNLSASRVLQDCVSRVKSIAAVHDILSQENMEIADILGISRKIAEIVGGMSNAGRSVDFRIDGDHVYLRSKQATSLALVLNELVSNAAKHAFRGLTEGRIEVTLEDSDADVKVIVRDNGTGLPVGFDLDRDSNLGLQIVRNVVGRDLGGRISWRNDGGAVWEVSFARSCKEEDTVVEDRSENSHRR